MKTILPIMTSVALLALAGPALAGKSTPKEIEATKQLNLEQAQLAKNTTQQIMAANSKTSSQTAQSQSAPAASPTTAVEAQATAPADKSSAPEDKSSASADKPSTAADKSSAPAENAAPAEAPNGGQQAQ